LRIPIVGLYFKFFKGSNLYITPSLKTKETV